MNTSKSVLSSINAEEIFSAIDNLHDAFVIIKAVNKKNKIIDFQYLYVNKAAANDFKLTVEEIVNQNISQLLPGLTKHEIFAKYVEAVEMQQAFTIDTAYYEEKIDNRIIKGYFSIKGTPVNDKIYLTWRDISELKIKSDSLKELSDELFSRENEIKKQHSTLKKILEIVPIGLWITDKDGTIIQANKTGHDIWQGAEYVSTEEFFKYKAWFVETGKLIEPHEWAVYKAINKGESTLNEIIEIECFDGKTHKTIINSCVPIYDDDNVIIGSVAVNQDITKLSQIQDELKESEKRFRNAIMDAPIPIIIFADDGRVLELNKMWTTLSGYTIEDIPTIQSLLTKAYHYNLEFFQSLTDEVNKINRSERRGEFELIAKNGNLLIWDFYNAPLGSLPDGRKLIISTAMDVTYRKKMEDALYKSELLFRSTFEQAAVGIAQCDLSGNLIRVNQKFCDIIGYTKDEILYKNFRIITPHDKITAELENMNQLLSGSKDIYTLEKQFIKHDGNLVWANLTVSLVRNEFGEAQHFIKVVEDIDFKKEAEKALEQLVENLENKNQELENFAHIISHDLQEPMRMIEWFSDFLFRKYKDQFDATATEYLTFIQGSAKRANNLIRDLIDFSRIDKAPVSNYKFDLKEVIETIKTDLQVLIKESNAVIIYDELPEIKANLTQIRQLFQNLIMNSIKFKSEEDPVIHISVKNENDYWTFSVSDNGIGIDKKHYDLIFVIFKQVYERDKYQGTGIGLAICKKIVEKHNGKIWVESEFNKGTTFYFTLPK